MGTIGRHWKVKDISKMKENCGRYIRTNGMRRKLSLSHKGLKPSSETLIKMSISQKKRFENKQNHPRWIKDRSLLKISKNKAFDVKYIYWARQVKLRDNYKCKMNNRDCFGRLESHHILSWKPYPELRYNINNGITLCQFHHPRKRSDEKRLIPFFNSMVEVKELI